MIHAARTILHSNICAKLAVLDFKLTLVELIVQCCLGVATHVWFKRKKTQAVQADDDNLL